MNKKSIVIIRHAHRSKKAGRHIDNGLSKIGKRQAKALSKYLRLMYGNNSLVILSSPKRRCIETVEPLSKLKNVEVAIVKDLDEGKPLRQKISRFFHWWRKESTELTIICSHGDWIPLALKTLTGAHIKLSKGGLIELKLDQGQILIERVLQNTDLNTLC